MRFAFIVGFVLGLNQPILEDISKSQRYKMLGNGFTVDVIAHILRSMPNG